jgi:hypothetical protein
MDTYLHGGILDEDPDRHSIATGETVLGLRSVGPLQLVLAATDRIDLDRAPQIAQPFATTAMPQPLATDNALLCHGSESQQSHPP